MTGLVVPPAPPCALWCDTTHEAEQGWDLVETRDQAVVGFAKTCRYSLDFFLLDEGCVEVVVERDSGDDPCVEGAVFVGDPHVRLNMDALSMRGNVDVSRQVAEALAQAVQLAAQT